MNVISLTSADVYEAVRQFVHIGAVSASAPNIPLNAIYQGWQNRSVLPANGNDYAVISIISETQKGTNASAQQDEDLNIYGLFETSVQVDICADNDSSRQRATSLKMLTRSTIGANFLKSFGISALHAEDVRDLSFVGDAQQFVRRHMTTLHLSYVAKVSVEYDYFNQAKLERCEDVSVHHKE